MAGITWAEFAAGRPDLAERGRALLYPFGSVGLGYLSTVRADGGPRVHPVCPLLDGSSLTAFIVPSPKQDDLRRDGRYALHCFPPNDNEDAFYVTGTALVIDDPARRAALGRQFVDERATIGVPLPEEDHALFELLIERCLVTTTTGHGDGSPQHEIWRAR